MAKALIRAISCLKIPSFSHYFHHFLLHYSNHSNNLPIIHRISSILNRRFIERSHLYQIHAQLITSGRIQNPFFCSKLINLSSQVEDLRYILWVFDFINYPDIVCVNAVIKAYSFSSSPFKGVNFYFDVLKNGGIFPNSYTFPPLIRCCSKFSVIVGEMCHGQVIKYGFDGVLQIENSLIHMYACFGVIEIALKVFEELLERDSVSWNSMMDGFVKVGDLRRAHHLFDVMPERNVVSWNALMTGYLNGKNPGCVLKLFREMVNAKVLGNDTTMAVVLAACGRSARLKEGASLHGYLLRRLWKLNLITNTALIDMYNKYRKVDVARSIFDSLPQKNLVCWNSMILGHCLHGNPKDGLKLLEEMVIWTKSDLRSSQQERLLPDEITYVGVLCACTRAELLDEGRIHFRQMVDTYGLKPNFAHYWCMANLLASNGLVQEALETVRKVSEYSVEMPPESLVWAILLGSCRFQGDVSEAERVAKALIELEPNNTMCYALLLNIYAAAGRWEEAAKVRDLTKEKVAGNLPGCSLIDLIEIVHDFRVGDKKQCGVELVTMMDAVLRLNGLNSQPEKNASLKIECQT
ncbi:hypothetical protein RND81_13G215600 [Saponaria officinalis]|uniref:Pentatricopeptide repeat-containing protein n=1 Tax=Saponaria officinalis TaxID=3572 RepID=A0AAW1H6X8_SAPOF